VSLGWAAAQAALGLTVLTTVHTFSPHHGSVMQSGDPKSSQQVLDLGLGGRTVKVRFADLRVRLLAPGGSDDQLIEWQAESGFVDQWIRFLIRMVGLHFGIDALKPARYWARGVRSVGR